MIRFLVLAWAGLFLGKTPPAAAEPVTVEVTPFDLADGRIPVPDGVTAADAGEKECALKKAADANEWRFDPDACKKLGGLTSRVEIGTLEFQLAEGTTLKGSYQHDPDNRTVAIETAKPIERIAFPGTSDRWEVVAWTKDQAPHGALREYLSGETVRDLWGIQGTTLYALSLDRKPDVADGPPPCPYVDVDEWCKRPPGMGEAELICIDAAEGRFEPKSFTPVNHVLPPNRSVVVIVHHAGDHGVEIEMKGTRGLYDAQVANYTGGLLDKNLQQVEGVTPRVCTTATVASFAPRKPGDADVEIELRDRADRTKVLAEETIELIVETTYIGAIRLGFASILGNAVDRAYEAHMAPGSSTSEIAVKETGEVNVEVVVGMSAYLFDLLADGGRRYASRPTWSYLLPSPYVGIGVVTSSADGLRAIPSLHVGAEWEVSKSFAISVNAVARRVTRLSEGYAIGSPVSATTSFTEERHEWGWALVFSVSPEFFQLAVGKP